MADKETVVCEGNSRVGDLGGGDILSNEKNECGIGPCWLMQRLGLWVSKNWEAVSGGE